MLDAKIADARNDRAGLAPDIPADLMALYDKLAASHNGVGAAELRRRRCTGCQLEVNAADLRTIAAATPDEVHPLRGVRPDPDPHGAVRADPVTDLGTPPARSAKPPPPPRRRLTIMPARTVGLPSDVPDDLETGLAALRERLSIPVEFPADVLAAAEQAAAHPRLA